MGNIPDFCPYRNKCRINKSAECHLTLIRRKKITRLDEKQLILMAEQRGLFGEIDLRKERKPNHSKTTKIDEKTKEKTRIRTDEDIMEIVTTSKYLVHRRLLTPLFIAGRESFAADAVIHSAIINSIQIKLPGHSDSIRSTKMQIRGHANGKILFKFYKSALTKLIPFRSQFTDIRALARTIAVLWRIDNTGAGVVDRNAGIFEATPGQQEKQSICFKTDCGHSSE